MALRNIKKRENKQEKNKITITKNYFQPFFAARCKGDCPLSSVPLMLLGEFLPNNSRHLK